MDKESENAETREFVRSINAWFSDNRPPQSSSLMSSETLKVFSQIGKADSSYEKPNSSSSYSEKEKIVSYNSNSKNKIIVKNSTSQPSKSSDEVVPGNT